MKTAIEVSKLNEVSIAITPHAELAKKEALESAAIILKVENDMQQQMAADARVSLKRVLKQVEASRKDVKAPVLEMGKAIDRLAANFSDELQAQDARIESLILPYELQKRKVAAEEEKKRQEAIAAIPQGTPQWEEAVRAKPIEAAKVEGQSARMVDKFEVLDLMALAKSHPHLVRMEPNVSAINGFLKSGLPVPASIRAWKEIDTTVRT